MTNLKDINFGINQYCGPAVLSALTGESTDRCAAVISAVSGKKEIKAVQHNHLIEALKRLRFDVIETEFIGSTLFGVLHRMHIHDGLYVVFVPNHVIAIEVKENEIFICDNHSKTTLDIKQSARLTQSVQKTLKVEPRGLPKFVRSDIEVKKDYTGTRVEIFRVNKYEQEEDNSRVTLGYIRYNDISDLEDIINELAKIGEV